MLKKLVQSQYHFKSELMPEYQIQKNRFENQPAPLNAEYSGVLNEQMDRRKDREAGRIYAWHTDHGINTNGTFWIDGIQHFFSFGLSSFGIVSDGKGNKLGTGRIWSFATPRFGNSPRIRVKFWINGKVFRGSLWKIVY